MNVKMKRYLKALVAFVLALAMVSEAWGGLSFVSEAEISAEVSAQAESGKVGEAFPTYSGSDYVTYWTNYSFDSTDYYIETVDQFANLAKACRSGCNFSGITIHLANHINYGADETYRKAKFYGIGRDANSDTDKVRPFSGTFDGHEFKVIGLTGPLFGYLKDATVKNFTVDGATVGPYEFHKGAVVATYSGENTIDNVHVTNNTTVTTNADFGAIVAGNAEDNGSITISNCTVTDCTLVCGKTTSTTATTGYGILVGDATGAVTIEKTTVTGCAINITESTWASNIGGFVGTMMAGGLIKDSSVSGLTVTGAYVSRARDTEGHATTVDFSENIGGAVGYMAGTTVVNKVAVDNANITMANVFDNAGGFAGCIANGEPTFTECSVTNTNITGTEMIKDASTADKDIYFYKGIAGFAGCVIAKATFEKSFVDATNVKSQTRYKYGGGFIGSTFSYDLDEEGLPTKGIINMSQCYVTNTKVYTGANRNCNVGGGLIALLAEGSTVTDCYVYNFTASQNRNSLYIGGLIGDIYDIQKGSAADGKTVVKNCYVGKATLKGYHYIGPVIGDIDPGVDITGLSNLLHCKLQETASKDGEALNEELHVWIERNLRDGETPSINTYDQVKEVSHESFTNRELAFILNCNGSDGNPSSDIWMQGAEYPVFSDGSEKPIRKVIFQAEGESFAYYTNAQGKLDAYPQPDDGYKWKGYDLDTIKDVVFEENTWIYQILINEELKVSNYEAYMDTETDFYIDSLEELQAFRTLVNTKHYTFEGKTIHLLVDIDMSSIADWGGIGTTTYPFGGTFDGHGYTISGMKATDAGLFQAIGSVDGSISQPTVKNFTMDGATISSAGYGKAIVVSRIVGTADDSSRNSQVLNVHVKKSSVKATGGGCGVIVGTSQDNGNGSVTISGCTATKCTMTCTATAGTGVARWAFIMGRDMSKGYTRIVGCTATDCEMISNNDNIDYTGGILGDGNSNIEIEECIVDGCTIECAPNAEDTITCIGGIAGSLRNTDVTVRDCIVTGTEITLKGVATDVGLVAGWVQGGTITGAKVKDSTLNLDYATDTTKSERIGAIGSVGLLATASALPTIEIDGCELEGNTIEIDGVADSVGGLVGKITEFTEEATIKDSSIKDTSYNCTYVGEETSIVYNVGGAIGQTQRDIIVENVNVEGFKVALSNHANEIGGFIGTADGTDGSVFNNCKVIGYVDANGTKTASSIKQTNLSTQRTSDYTHHFAGFAALALTPSTFTSCYVESMDVSTNVRTNAFGGIVGSTYKTGETPTKYGIVTINRCSVVDVSVETVGGWRDIRIGGVVGALAEGSTVTNCLVSEFTRENNKVEQSGILIGRIHDSDATEELRCTIKNCYLQNSVIKTSAVTNTGDTTGLNYLRVDMGICAGLRDVEHVKFYNCKVVVAGTESTSTRHATVVEDPTDLTDKDLAYALNTTNGTEPHNGSWAQGPTNPVIATEDNYPVAYVTYLHYNGDTRYKCMEYLIFPISPNGTIDYENGTRKYISKTSITAKEQVNRQELTNGETEQEKIELYNEDGSYKHYKEVWVEEPCTIYTSEPLPNSGRVWQYPNGKIKTDVTITQVEKTAWDFNGDTELSVSDLVRRKKVEQKGVTSSLNKASIIGTMLTQDVYEMDCANIVYDENKDLVASGYLPSYRLRRIILTPPSTTVSVLSYNMYYTSYTDAEGNAIIDDTTRQDAIMEMLGLNRPKDNYTLSTRGEYEDNTVPKADIIALQEVSADYWHTRLYRQYLAPYQYSTTGDANDNGVYDPSEVTSKKYYTYEHFGRGRYGHVFYNTEGSAFAGDSYTLIIYNQYTYRYVDGDSGTIYLSTTPTVASQGWDDEAADSVLDSQRAANWAIFTNRKTGEKFMFVNVHLSHDETGVDRQVVRMKQMELILRRIKEILGQESRKYGLGEASGGMPIVITGDFNAYIGADAYSLTLEQGYEDARDTAEISTEQHGAYNHWTTTDETKYAYGDHVLVNDRARVQTFEVIDGDEVADADGDGEVDDTYMNYTLYNDTYHYSDHCPIRATVDIGSDYIASTTAEKTGHEYHEVLGLY